MSILALYITRLESTLAKASVSVDGSVDILDTEFVVRIDKSGLTVFSDRAGGTMAEVGLLPFARVALQVAT
ncbi:MAG TPA: hypothetical protein VFI75_00935, partial [Candidatus Acidoferrum sp.]|nr:hypothetical protein [Candidatus Acidoferrum sp.]